MTTFLALYRGKTIGEAHLVATRADPDLVNVVSTRLLALSGREKDPVVTQLEHGRRGALQLIKQEVAKIGGVHRQKR